MTSLMKSLWLAVFGKSSNKVDRHGDSASVKIDDEPLLSSKFAFALAAPRTESREQCVQGNTRNLANILERFHYNVHSAELVPVRHSRIMTR